MDEEKLFHSRYKNKWNVRNITRKISKKKKDEKNIT